MLIAAGTALDERRWREQGLTLLTWLLDVETAPDEAGGHLSVTAASGWAPGEPRPAYDQQPIEVAALADAAARAFDASHDPLWRDAIRRCDAWFEGANDVGVSLADPESGGCRDGLMPGGRNENQGAESTLALLSVRQQAYGVWVPIR